MTDGECAPDCPGELSLVTPFLTDNPYFVYGWEACALDARLSAGEEVIAGYYHSANDEQLLLMASKEGYSATLEVLDSAPEWSRMVFTRRVPPEPA